MVRHTVNTVEKEALSLCEYLGALDDWEKHNFRADTLSNCQRLGLGVTKVPMHVRVTMWGHTQSR